MPGQGTTAHVFFFFAGCLRLKGERKDFAETKAMNTLFTTTMLIPQFVDRFMSHLFKRGETLANQQSIYCFLII